MCIIVCTLSLCERFDVQDSWDDVVNITLHYAKDQDIFQQFAGPGQWNDPDMLIIGDFSLSLSQQMAQMAIWAIYASVSPGPFHYRASPFHYSTGPFQDRASLFHYSAGPFHYSAGHSIEYSVDVHACLYIVHCSVLITLSTHVAIAANDVQRSEKNF